MLAGVSTRRFRRTQEPVGTAVETAARSTARGTTEGVKIPLGLWEGSTKNAAVATALLADLVDRGLDTASRSFAIRSACCVRLR